VLSFDYVLNQEIDIVKINQENGAFELALADFLLASYLEEYNIPEQKLCYYLVIKNTVKGYLDNLDLKDHENLQKVTKKIIYILMAF
jgi:hypothetical protein